jgi:hypothetical protein
LSSFIVDKTPLASNVRAKAGAARKGRSAESGWRMETLMEKGIPGKTPRGNHSVPLEKTGSAAPANTEIPAIPSKNDSKNIILNFKNGWEPKNEGLPRRGRRDAGKIAFENVPLLLLILIFPTGPGPASRFPSPSRGFSFSLSSEKGSVIMTEIELLQRG